MFLVNVEKCLNILSKVYVSSDNKRILKLAESAGAIPILREQELCGETPNIPVYKHALKKMAKASGIIAVQANSPTVELNLIALVKKLLELGIQEVMTCHSDYALYGSIWGLSQNRLENYGDPYLQNPDILIVDKSVDIHDWEDYDKALKQ